MAAIRNNYLRKIVKLKENTYKFSNAKSILEFNGNQVVIMNQRVLTSEELSVASFDKLKAEYILNSSL